MAENLSHLIRSFNRFELKYLTPLAKAETFKQELRAYLVPDNHGDENGTYLVSSLYYDSPGFACYHEKVDGVHFRRKLRIRRYGDTPPLSDDSPVFVEIKQRLNRVTQKRRIVLPYAAALSLCNSRQAPGEYTGDTLVLDEILHMLLTYDLQPASLVRYSRQAFIGSEQDIGLRVTFDRDLQYLTRCQQPDELNLAADTSLALFPPEWVVVEIKVNERIPYWLTEMAAASDLTLARVSKYCRSIELAQRLAPTTETIDWNLKKHNVNTLISQISGD